MRSLITVSFLLAIGLSACDTVGNPDLIVHVPTVVIPPAGMLNCPLSPLPDNFKTNNEAANFLADTYNNNRVCHYNMNSIKKYLNAAAAKLKG